MNIFGYLLLVVEHGCDRWVLVCVSAAVFVGNWIFVSTGVYFDNENRLPGLWFNETNFTDYV